ncbi:MAG: hypothetical protein IT198_03100 [Acidimicrobiia bacterium]|nr:hypothetical protein [Acidimicrobiia bacterium]
MRNSAIRVSEPRKVIPGPGLPDDVKVMRANNNLDLVEHAGRLHLAFRTAIFHFASPRTRMYVLASDDGGHTWTRELTVDRGRDVREPRLLSWNGRLFFYFFEAGTNPFTFQPGRVFASERADGGSWSDPVAISDAGCVAWRTKTIDGVPYMTRYRGGEHIYRVGGGRIGIELLTTEDGFDWQPVDPETPVVYTGGGSETDFEFAPDGRLIAVSRNELGDATGWGSLVCEAPADAISTWRCVNDPRKFDSLLMFRQGDDVYMLARRQVASGGRYDLGRRRLPGPIQHLLYEAAYWVTPKRSALWHVDTDALRVEWVLDLPSRGDTAFPAVVRRSPTELVVYDYSSPLTGPDVPWLMGQLGPTHIYETVLTFP